MAEFSRQPIVGPLATARIRWFTVTLSGLLLVTVPSSPKVMGQSGNPPASPVVVSKVVATNQPTSQAFVGTLVPIRTSVVGSAADGRVVDILVDEGDPVFMTDQQDAEGRQRGQTIVQLRTVSLDIEITAAEVELQSRQHAQEELKQALPTEIESAEAVSQEIKARRQYSKSDFERLQALAQQGGGIPKREIEEAFSTYSSLRQSSIAADALLKKLVATREVRLSQAKARVEAQKQEIRRLQELKDQLTIRTPFAGYVTSKSTELGAWVSRGDPVLEIIQLDPIELVINVPQNYIGQLQHSLNDSQQKRQKYMAQVDVDSVGELLEGEVVRIVPQADLRSRSFPVVLRLDNPRLSAGHLLKSGMLARASLFVGREERILLVKKDALVLGGPQIIVYVVRDNSATGGKVVQAVSVQTGASIGQWIQVAGELAESDLVVCEGNERLRPGQAVEVVQIITDTLPEVSRSSTIN